MVEMAIFNIYNVPRAVTPKVNQSSGSYVLHVVSWCFTFVRDFMKIAQTDCNKMAMFNVQSEITPKEDKLELQFICSVCHLMVLYIPVKFQQNITNGFRVIKLTQVHGRNSYFQYL